MDKTMIHGYLPLRRPTVSFFVSMGVCIVSTVTWMAYQPVCKKIECFIQGSCTGATSPLIKKSIEEKKNKVLKSSDIAKALLKEYAWIDTIHLHTFAHKDIFIINKQKPYLSINDTSIITHTAQLIDTDYYPQAVIKPLPHLQVDPDYLLNSHAASTIFTYMQTFPSPLLDFYTIEWINENKIYLHDIHNPHYSLLTRADKLITPHHFTMLLKIKKSMYQQSPHVKHNSFVADMRFSDYIIIAKKGNMYGTNVSKRYHNCN